MVIIGSARIDERGKATKEAHMNHMNLGTKIFVYGMIAKIILLDIPQLIYLIIKG